MEDDKFKDLLEDEELTALRLAALATKKKNEKNVDNLSEAASALPINSIVTASESVSNQIPFLQSDRNAFSNNYAWRKLNQTTRRRGGVFPKKPERVRRRNVIKLTVKSVKPHKKYSINKSRYKKINPLDEHQDSLPKNNQRSNLIVISPVVLNEGKDPEEKAPALLLPQHKWCNSGNEDSMSPKTLRKTGPTRFNRHGSDSESSDDSDYELSDNDSGSNETVLQDEPSEKFSRLSPDSDSVSDNVEKKRRLSFQRLDSDVKTDNFDKTETTSVYNLLKNSSYSDNKQDNYAPAQNLSDNRHNWSHSAEGEYSSYKQYSSGRAYTTKHIDAPESFTVKQSHLSVPSNGESNVDKSNPITQSKETSNTWHHERNRTNDSYQDNSRNLSSNDQKSKTYLDNRQSLPESGEMQSLKHSVWQHESEVRASSSFYSRETTYNSKNYKENASKSQLSESDLRLELKKRMQEVKSQPAAKDSSDTTQKRYDQRNPSDKGRQRYAYEESKFGDTQTDKSKRNFSDDQDSSAPSQRRGSESRGDNLLDSLGSGTKRKFEYSERNRYDRSSSLDRNRNDRSPSRDRNRHDRSSSWDSRRRDRSSSPNKSKSSNRESHSAKSRNSVDRNLSSEKKTDKFKSSQNRRLSERSSSRDRSKRDRSSSSESRRSRSLSRDRYRRGYYSSRNRRSRHASRDRKRHKHSLSRDRHSRSSTGSRYSRSRSRDRSSSRGSTSDRSRSRGWSKGSSNPDESRANLSASKNKSASQNSLSSSKYSINRKSKHDESFSQEQDRKDSVSDLEQGKKNSHKKIEYTQNSTQMSKKELEKSVSKEQSNSVEGSRLKRAGSSEKKDNIKRSPRKFNRGSDSYKDRYSRSRSSSSDSYSSSFSSSSNYSSKPKLRSVPSVIKPVVTNKLDSKGRDISSESKISGKSICSAISKSDTYSVSKADSYKKNIDVSDSNKVSTIKCRIDGDLKVSDNNKRVPVHMRLGAFPRKRVIQMPKDVEAAFVNTSSSSDSENVNTKCKRQNFRIVTNVYDTKTGVDSVSLKHLPAEKPAKRSPDMYQEKSKRLKAHR